MLELFADLARLPQVPYDHPIEALAMFNGFLHNGVVGTY